MEEREIEIQALQYVDGAMTKKISFDEWAISKDLSTEERKGIIKEVMIIIYNRIAGPSDRFERIK